MIGVIIFFLRKVDKLKSSEISNYQKTKMQLSFNTIINLAKVSSANAGYYLAKKCVANDVVQNGAAAAGGAARLVQCGSKIGGFLSFCRYTSSYSNEYALSSLFSNTPARIQLL